MIKIVKSNKGRTTRVYVINTERKRLLKQRRDNALQNAKDRKIGKANAQIALKASTRVNKASKDIQDIEMTDNAATGKDSTVDIHLPPQPSRKAKHPSQIKTSPKHTTAIAEPSIGDPLPDSQVTVKVNCHMPDLADIGKYEFLIQGAPNPPDLEGVEEDQLLEIQQNILLYWGAGIISLPRFLDSCIINGHMVIMQSSVVETLLYIFHILLFPA